MKLDLDTLNLTPKTLEEAIEVTGQLVKIILELKKENDALREQLNNNSNNSSLPPSSDMKKKKKPNIKSGRHRGGQPGHKAYQRTLVPAEQVDAMVDCKPAERCACGGRIQLKDKPQRHQVFEIPVAKYEVIEYRIYKGCCEVCHLKQEGQLPEGVSWKGFGVRAQAMLSLLTSQYCLSKRLAQSWFRDVYQMPISLGSVSKVEHTVSQSLSLIHDEVLAVLRTEKVLHVDETGYKACHRNGWAWIASAVHYTGFKLTQSRGRKVAKELIGHHQDRIIITDRYSAYNYLPDINHQLCWAHLKRDFQKISERTGQAGQIGHQLLKTYRQLFEFWKTESPENSTFSKKQKKRLRYLKNKLLRGLVAGTHCDHERTKRTCENILNLQQSLWHFFGNKAIPPTNNQAERQLRPLVISKKLTFGTQSDRGRRFIERIFTVVMSCKQQGRDVFAFIVDAVQKHFSGKMPPSLLVHSVGP